MESVETRIIFWPVAGREFTIYGKKRPVIRNHISLGRYKTKKDGNRHTVGETGDVWKMATRFKIYITLEQI